MCNSETKKNLKIQIEDIVFDSKLKKSTLYNSKFYEKYFMSSNDINKSYIWVNFHKVFISDEEMSISMCFKEENLESVNMIIFDEDFPTSWENWSQDNELRRKKKHDSFLEKIFHRVPDSINQIPQHTVSYYFEWGEVSSLYDGKSGGSYIVFNFVSKSLEYSNN